MSLHLLLHNLPCTVMVEGSAHEVREEKLCEAVLLGFQEVRGYCSDVQFTFTVNF